MRAKVLLAAALSLFIIGPAAAAFTRVQGGTHSNGATSTTTIAVTLPAAVTAGDMVIVSVGWASSAADTITSIKDDKNDTLSLVDLAQSQSFYVGSGYLLSGSITAGAQIFTATISTARQFGSIWVDEFSGVAGTLDGHLMSAQDLPPTTANSISSGLITTTTNGDLIYGATVNLAGNASQSVGTGFTQAQIVAQLFLSEFLTQATAGSVAATMTPASSLDHWITYVMAFKAASSGGGPVAHLRLLKDVGP